VAAIHVLEHFYEWEAESVLKEWRRILKPGGKLILELPCLDKVMRYMAHSIKMNEPMLAFMTLHALYGDPKYHDVSMCHKWAYFEKSLGVLLEKVGMREIHFMEPRYHFPMRDQRVECIK